jgi:hypothetical protein
MSGELPLAGPFPTLLPSFILNIVFATKATALVQDGYTRVGNIEHTVLPCSLLIQFKTKAYQILRQDGIIIVLPASLLEELSALPSTIASPHSALERDLLRDHTGLDLVMETRMHHTIVQRKLTPRLPTLTPSLERELMVAFEDEFPTCDNRTKFKPYQVFGKISARLSAQALVGPELCQNSTWLDISVNYTENRKWP